jgi:hypothetical protein
MSRHDPIPTDDHDDPPVSTGRRILSSSSGLLLVTAANLAVTAVLALLVTIPGRTDTTLPPSPPPPGADPHDPVAASGPLPPPSPTTGAGDAPAPPGETPLTARSPDSRAPGPPATDPPTTTVPPGPPGTGTPTTGCTSRDERRVDPNTGQSWNTARWCPTMAGHVYLGANASTVVGWLDASWTALVCYRHGSTHAGGNDVWYYAQGDRAAPGYEDRVMWGFLPADHAVTTRDPEPALPACNPYLWQVDQSQVDYRGHTWSSVWYGQNRPSPLAAEPGSAVVIGRLETNTTWFVCYATVAETGGDQVWYYTQGDHADPQFKERHAWGWAPASVVVASRHPYDGVPRCGDDVFAAPG